MHNGQMRNRQKGVTFIGWLFLLTPIAVVGYAGIRLAPLYLNYMKVVKALDQAGGELKGGANPQSIRASIDKHFEIDMVDYPTTKDLKITRDGGSWVVESKYDDDAPLFANVSLHVTFDKVVTIGTGGGE
jgi:ribosomal protein L11